MGKDLIGYDALVENGLRSVVREALRRVAEDGWPGTHHAYIAFKTDAPGVEVPDFLRTRYPDELTIVLQNQFWGLDRGRGVVRRDAELQQGGRAHHRALRGAHQLCRPSVKFGLQFGQQPAAKAGTKRRVAPKARGAGSTPQRASAKAATEANAGAAGAEEEQTDAAAPEAAEENVVTLDRFRKK